jgi:hypothetical protein
MRNPLPLLSCLVGVLSVGLPAGLPAVAQPRPATLPVSLGPVPEEAEKSSIGFIDLPRVECRPVYVPGVRLVGPPMADAEQRTEGMVVAGQACDARR